MLVVRNFVWGIVLTFFAFFTEPFWKLGHPTWLILAIVLACVMIVVEVRFPRSQYRIKEYMTIREAITHIINTNESYRLGGSEVDAYRAAFRDLHGFMTVGKVRIWGALHSDSKKANKISRKLCKKLEPRVGQSAIGPVFSLINPNPSPPAVKTVTAWGKGEVRWKSQGIYHDLRLRSKDVYKIWPQYEKEERSC